MSFAPSGCIGLPGDQSQKSDCLAASSQWVLDNAHQLGAEAVLPGYDHIVQCMYMREYKCSSVTQCNQRVLTRYESNIRFAGSYILRKCVTRGSRGVSISTLVMRSTLMSCNKLAYTSKLASKQDC